MGVSEAACGNSQDTAETNQTSSAGNTDSGSSAAPANTEKQPVPSDGQEADSTGQTEADNAEQANSAGEGTMTGKIDTNAIFMITVISGKDGETYVFALDDAQSKEYESLKAGDKIRVSYKNGLPTPDSTDTVVTGIKKL